MNKDIMHFAPRTWDLSTEVGEIPVDRYTNEFKDVEYDLLRAVEGATRVLSLTRYQSVYDFGQFLMRSQILAIGQSDKSWYKARRYVVISRRHRDLAIQHNLDYRRLGLSNELVYKGHVRTTDHDNDLIFVVKILTSDPNQECIIPYNFTEYFIEYIAEMGYY